MSLSSKQKVDIYIATLAFLFFVGYGSKIFLNTGSFHGMHIVILTILFFVWYGMSKVLTNFMIDK